MGCYVNYKIAKKLKEKGFSLNKEYIEFIGCRFIFSDECTIKRISTIGAYEKGYFGENIDCPTISQVLKWLRNEKKMHINTGVYQDESEDADGKIVDEWCFWNWDIQSCFSGNILQDGDDVEYESYEQASLAGIKYVLDNLI